MKHIETFDEYVWRNQNIPVELIKYRTGRSSQEIWEAYDREFEKHKGESIGKPMRYMEKWTADEIKVLKDMDEAGESLEAIATALGRTVASVTYKRGRVRRGQIPTGIRHARWTATETRRLMELRENGYSVRLIAKELNRSERSVEGKLRFV